MAMADTTNVESFLMKQQFAKGHGLKLKPLALGLALVLAAGSAQADAPAFGQQHTRARQQAMFEQIREHFHRSPDYIQKVAAAANTRDPQVIDQILAERKARSQARAANPRPAGTVTVSTCADSGAGSLRDAVAGAVDGDTIDLSALACSTITLTSGAVNVEVNNLAITGPGSTALTIDGNANDAIINLYGDAYNDGSATLTLSGVTLTNGAFDGAPGGAIWAYGNLDLDEVAVTDSHTTGNLNGDGGGGLRASGNIVLSNSTVSGNSADSDKYNSFGGGVVTGGDLTVVNSTISGNTAKANGSYTYEYYGYVYYYFGFGGGGGALANGNITVTNSTISGNDAALGGGLVGLGTEMTLQNSTITGNDASLDNQSFPEDPRAEGGGVVGGNYYEAFTATLNSTIIAGNTANTTIEYGADFAIFEGKGGPATVTGANNLVVDSSNPMPAGTLTANPMLGPLASNGGSTLTHALLAGSPAIDTGNNVAGLTTDQRGGTFVRVSGATADIGAFEVQGNNPGPGPGGEPHPVRAVPAASTWALGMLALLLGFLGWRRTER